MTTLRIALVSPSGFIDKDTLAMAKDRALGFGIDVMSSSKDRQRSHSFLNGSRNERLEELCHAESLSADGIWCTRGGCGALELWKDYEGHIYQDKGAPLIGYSDITIYHLMRFIRAKRIGIHGPVLTDLLVDGHRIMEPLDLLLKKRAEKLSYPTMRSLNHFLKKRIEGELLVMNLSSLQSLMGCFDNTMMHGKILAIEDVNEPHYRLFRALLHLKHAGALTGLKALILGHFGKDRSDFIKDTAIPLADELGIPLFDWAIFGHEKPNWPLLFGAKSSICSINDSFYTLSYLEQHDHTPIHHER